MAEVKARTLQVYPTTADSTPCAALCISTGMRSPYTLLVTTRPEYPSNPNVYQFMTSEFQTLMRAPPRVPMFPGVALLIDAQPDYKNGRALATIDAEHALRIAKLAVARYGAALHHVIVVCDQAERAAILAGLEAIPG